MTSGIARGSDDEYCSSDPGEAHVYQSTSVPTAGVWVGICMACRHIDGVSLAEEIAHAVKADRERRGFWGWLDRLIAKLPNV